jgi:hypothetical protein
MAFPGVKELRSKGCVIACMRVCHAHMISRHDTPANRAPNALAQGEGKGARARRRGLCVFVCGREGGGGGGRE